MNFPPIHHDDLIAFGMSPDASISTLDGISPPPGWLAARVFAGAISSPPPEDASAYCRHVRDLVLSATDWTQAADSPLSEEQRAAWANYRQALRDLPQTYSGGGPISWPVAPS